MIKLKVWNKENCKALPPVKPAIIYFVKKTGCIRISKAACELMELKAFDMIEFIQNEDDAPDWYIVKNETITSFELRKEGKGEALVFNNAFLVKNIFESVEFDGASAKCNIGREFFDFEDGKVYWQLITAMIGLKK